MDRRVLLAGLFGAAGTAAVAAVLPFRTEALAGMPLEDPLDGSNVLPNLEDLKADSEEDGPVVLDEGVQLASHRRRRRRRRHRRWRRICRREWWYGHYRRRCRRRPFWIWLSIG